MSKQRQDYEKVSLANIARGQLSQVFDEAIDAVVENILDINTPTKKMREININLKFAPNEDRTFCAVNVNAKTKLVARKGIETGLYIGREQGHPVALQNNASQDELFDNDTTLGVIQGGQAK